MPKVFVTQLPTRREHDAWVPTVDVTPATEFGELVYMLPPGMNYPDSLMAINQLRPKLRAFDQDKDFLLPMGDPIVMAAAAAILGAGCVSFRILKWDRGTHRYTSIKIVT